HAESSMCMYSEHGFEALMRPVFGDVCQALIVVSYCTPGSAHSQAACAICRSSSRASRVLTTVPSVRAVRLNSLPSVAASMKETGPDAWPPFDSCSCEERRRERLTPEPEPPRKMTPSRRIQSRIESIESSIERMKQAEHCGFSSKPTLNHTGLLNATYWLTSRALSSASNVSASSSLAK